MLMKIRVAGEQLRSRSLLAPLSFRAGLLTFNCSEGFVSQLLYKKQEIKKLIADRCVSVAFDLLW